MKKCYYKPTRSSPRYFKTCDVARIAANCVSDNAEVDVNVLLACVAERLGFESIVLHPDHEQSYDLYLAVEADAEGLTLAEYKQKKEEESLRNAIDSNELDIDLTILGAMENAFQELVKFLVDFIKGN